MPKAASSSTHAHNRQVSLPSDQDADSPAYSPEDTSGQPPSSPRTTALLRKRKNADAQAAFRARRANYIANLEETGEFFVFPSILNFSFRSRRAAFVSLCTIHVAFHQT